MKKVMNRTKAFIVALMAIIGTSFSNPVLGTETNNDNPGIEIRYLGFQQKNPVFEIVIKNIKEDSFMIKIRDESGTVLYSEKLSGKNLSRTYRIDTEEQIADGGLRFEVTSMSNKKTDVYIVGVTETVSREMAVNKIQ